MSIPSSDSAAIRQIIRALKAADHKLISVEDEEHEFTQVTTETAAIEAIMAVDISWLHVKLPTGDTGWLFFVLGNDPDEVVNDHTVNLSPVLDPLMEGWWSAE